MTPQAIKADSAGTWTLGDLTVNRTGFGAMRLTSNADGAPSDRGLAISVLRRARELGVNHIDTAAFYFSPLRSANELINRALAPYPDDLVITTKVWPGRDPSGEWLWATPQQLRGQVEENLRQLGRDHLDVVNLRLPQRMKTGSIAEHFGAQRPWPPVGACRSGANDRSAHHTPFGDVWSRAWCACHSCMVAYGGGWWTYPAASFQNSARAGASAQSRVSSTVVSMLVTSPFAIRLRASPSRSPPDHGGQARAPGHGTGHRQGRYVND